MANKRFATTLLAACLATTCLGYGAFASDPSLYFYPAQKWNVAQTGGDDAAPSCALSNSFNNGFGINISGTPAGLSALEIDFRQSSFEAGKRYEVVYSVPGQSREIFQATARTGSVLSSDISSRAAFSEALQSAATMDLSIQGNEFRLYLTGFAKAMEEYRDCISPPAAIAAIDEMESPAETPPLSAEPIAAEAGESAASAIAATEISSAPADADLMASAPPIMPEPAASEIASASSDTPETDGKKKEMDDIVAQATSLADRYEASRSPAAEAPEPIAFEDSSQPFFDAPQDQAAADEISDPLPALDQAEDAPAPEPVPTPARETRPRFTEKLQNSMSARSEQYKPEESAAKASALSAPVGAPADAPETAEPASAAQNGPSGDVLKTKDDVIFFGAPKPPEEDEKQSASEIDSAPMPAPKPEHKSVTIPAYKMTKQSASMEADLTGAGLPPEATEPAAGEDFASSDSMDSLATASAALEPSSGIAGEDFIQMRDKIRDLESEISRLSSENQTLDNELKSNLKDAEEERLSVSSDNWNLERATMRYNEAERQLKRLGRQLQAARQQCTSEKQELETMLFDPQVTEQQQLAKLSAMEEELAKAQTELQNAQRRYEERIRILEGQLAAQ